MQKLKDIVGCIMGALLIFSGICLHVLKPGVSEVENVKIIETIDTVTKVVTEERVVYRDVTRVDTVWLTRVQVDTLKIHDTVRVLMPIETKVYEDSSYRAVISGYKPSLESITVYPLTRVVEVTKFKKPRKVSVGITLGPQGGVYYTPQGWRPGIGVGATIGVSFNLRQHK